MQFQEILEVQAAEVDLIVPVLDQVHNLLNQETQVLLDLEIEEAMDKVIKILVILTQVEAEEQEELEEMVHQIIQTVVKEDLIQFQVQQLFIQEVEEVEHQVIILAVKEEAHLAKLQEVVQEVQELPIEVVEGEVLDLLKEVQVDQAAVEEVA
jgi:hypothetical protein